MKFLLYNNFLHYGDSLKYLKNFNLSSSQEEIYKKDIIDYFNNGEKSKYLIEIIQNYGTKRKRRIDIISFKKDIDNSLKFQILLKKLDCRGFSYYFLNEMVGFRYKLRREINLRFALMTGNNLFYPPKVKKYLFSERWNHYKLNNYPSIAFALGSKIKTDWYIFVIQSDLIFGTHACIREHFRGWRKVLLFNILNLAIKKNVQNIFLCTSKDIFECCHPRFNRPQKIPKIWKVFYDETAKFFNMKKVYAKSKINIQIFSRYNPIYKNRFYKLSLRKDLLFPEILED